MPSNNPRRPRSTILIVLLLWAAMYGSWTLVSPALLDDADSVHAEVAREMLLRHDWVTLYANGIRYLEKAPLLYWSMALCLKVAMWLGATGVRAMTVAVRVPTALTVLLLVWVVEMLARRVYASARAGLYAAVITLSSTGIFLFSHLTLPDVQVCCWLAMAMWAYLRFYEERPPWASALFGLACALGVLSKGLIGLVFPLIIVAIHSWWTRRSQPAEPRRAASGWLWALIVFVVVAAPWHVLAGLHNPGMGHPDPFRFVGGHWIVPLPTDGNVRGWYWFYFMNEHVLRYMNLRVPRDYDTSPLWLFWGLCLVWLMPWSAFTFKAVGDALRRRERGQMLLLVWAAVVLLFFSLSTRQEYYVLPALPAMAMLISGWLARGDEVRARLRCIAVAAVLGAFFAIGTVVVLLEAKAPAPGADLANLLRQHAGDYALSMGHFLDLDARALGMFRLPLAIAAVSLLGGPASAWWMLRKGHAEASVAALAAGAFGFLVAAHLGLERFAPVLTSAQLAQAIAPEVQPADIIAIHGEYESGSTLGFYLKRNDIHIVDGRSSNLWYGSFFPDAPKIFETDATLAAKWNGPGRIYLWQSVTDEPNQLPAGLAPVYVIAKNGGKEIVSNQPREGERAWNVR